MGFTKREKINIMKREEMGRKKKDYSNGYSGADLAFGSDSFAAPNQSKTPNGYSWTDVVDETGLQHLRVWDLYGEERNLQVMDWERGITLTRRLVSIGT